MSSVDPDTYVEPAGPGQAEERVKGSRFIARVMCARSPDEAATLLQAIRKAGHDATHHCSAWRTGPAGSDSRFDDDGEPSGTAGAPILRQIDAAGLTNVLVVVTRYYGGTKLGTGGLIRAYGGVARDAVAASPVVRRTIREAVSLRFPYDATSPAMHTISRFDAEIRETVYGDDTQMQVAVRRSQVEAFVEAFREALGGRGTVLGPDRES